MGMTSRRATRVVLVLLAIFTAAVLVDGMRLWQQRNWNELIGSGQPISEAKDLPVQVRFAQAYALAHAAAATGSSESSGGGGGGEEAARQRLRALQSDPLVGQAARYDSANLLMRQAIVVRAGAQPGQAIALIELAKETYRDVLRADPQHWNARYNLERAQRLLPDPDELLDAAPPETKRDAERAATTMRGYSPGLP